MIAISFFFVTQSTPSCHSTGCVLPDVHGCHSAYDSNYPNYASVFHLPWLQAEFAANPDFVYSERITKERSLAVLKVRTNLYVFIQGLPGCLPWGVLLTYLTDYLAQNKGMTVQKATVVRTQYCCLCSRVPAFFYSLQVVGLLHRCECCVDADGKDT